MMKTTFLLLAALILVSTGFCQNSGKLLLTKGQKYVIDNKITASSSQELMGQAMESKLVFSTLNNIEVKDIKNDNYTLGNTFTKITANINAMGQNINFDSDKKEDMEGDIGSAFKGIVGKSKNVIIDVNGKITPQEKDTAAGESEGGGSMGKMMMKQFMGDPDENGFGVSEAFLIIPAKAIKGYSWSDSSSSEGAKKFTTYTIKEIKGTDAIVTISGTLDVDSKTEMQGQEIAGKSTGKMNGEEVVDLKTGLITQKNTTIQTSGTVTVMGQDIPTTANVTTFSTTKSM